MSFRLFLIKNKSEMRENYLYYQGTMCIEYSHAIIHWDESSLSDNIYLQNQAPAIARK